MLVLLVVAALLMWHGVTGIRIAFDAYRLRRWDMAADLPLLTMSAVIAALGCAVAVQALATAPAPLLIQ